MRSFLNFLIFFVLAASAVTLFGADLYWGQGISAPATRYLITPRPLSEIPEKVLNRFEGSGAEPLRVYAVDIDQDRSDDYIVIGHMKGYDTSRPSYCFFVKSNMALRHWEKISGDFIGYQYAWFIKLDKNGPLCMIEKAGSGYFISRLRPDTWEPRRILPVKAVFENGRRKERLTMMNSAGIKDIRLKEDYGEVKLRASFIAPAASVADNSTKGPYIYFEGTQPAVSDYEEEFYTLKELLKKYHSAAR